MDERPQVLRIITVHTEFEAGPLILSKDIDHRTSHKNETFQSHTGGLFKMKNYCTYGPVMHPLRYELCNVDACKVSCRFINSASHYLGRRSSR